MLPASLARAAQNVAAQAAANGKILVVLELSGGNDGLNTVVPYADDAYYRARPASGCRRTACAFLTITSG
jgi:uncharacterized protein (DUF1501 family)